ncbi:MAG: dihydrolipoamide acetyltransferase family protein [Chitinophagaceae bacterium]|jgi:2-oxoglutarate dehydrogenase E2 component (dihydrolipoamide succinyltransferase)
MAVVDINMPKLGESIMEATVLKWHKKVGDAVKLDETLLDIATDKVDSEVPSTAEGILEEILCKENDVIPIGSIIARIRTAQSVASEPLISEPVVPVAIPQATPLQSTNSNGNGAAVPYLPSSFEQVSKSENGRFYSPLVMNIASREGIPLAELEKITGSGNDGRVTKKDILKYVEDRHAAPAPAAIPSAYSAPQEPVQQVYTAPPSTPIPSVEPSITGNVEVIEMDRMRRLISEHMTRSKSTSAHVTSFSEADVTNIVLWRNKVKNDFEKREGEKITLTPIFIEAIVACLRKFPMLNASVQGDKIIIKKDINIGMATALPSGNLIVPVLKGADHFNLIGLTKQVNRLANSARTGKLQPSDTQDGTFTFTNVGTFGSLMGTPIINQPQVAILATGAIKKKPIVVESEKGDSIAIRHMMFVSMSYDHRIIDGAMGASFLTEFVKTLESFASDRSI